MLLGESDIEHCPGRSSLRRYFAYDGTGEKACSQAMALDSPRGRGGAAGVSG